MAPSSEWADEVALETSRADLYPGQVIAENLDYIRVTTPRKPAGQALSGDRIEPVLPETSEWQKIRVSPGDSLSIIFDRLKISPAILYSIMTAGEESKALKFLLPGQELRFRIRHGKLEALEYDQDMLTTLHISLENDVWSSKLLKTELDVKVLEASATIDSSLFLAGQKAGLSDNLIMQLVAIYGWDIDFALDIRKGDNFRVIYEQQYKDDKKVGEGPILAAEFVNQGKTFRTVRYVFPDGRREYFADTGAGMRKAFLRTPLNFTRISSGFSLSRKHPVLNKIRAHRGVDYAAPTGTPVKAAGDGTVLSIGNNGGYGRTVVLKHGSEYTTLYAHLSKYASGLKKGSRVSQGQTIGYVGMSGLATGPHLHYEFRVRDVHRNPLTVTLPKSEPIPAEHMDDFRRKSAPLLAQLDKKTPQSAPMMIALREDSPLQTRPAVSTDYQP